MATKQAPKAGSGDQKKAAGHPQEAKEKEAPKETVKDDKKNMKAEGKDSSKETKDTNKKPAKEDKKEAGQGGGGGGHERGRGGRQDDHSRGRDRGRRTSRDRPNHRGHDKEEREVCRNFINNRCDRGSLCKYYHPRSSSRPRHGSDDPDPRRTSPVGTPGSGSGQIVCRDFIRNMCSRGTECRFYHPPSETSGKKRQGSWLTFCHDFRNGHCLRADCRFFHITREDEESYRATGEIPLHIVDQAVRKAMVLDGALTGTRPTCKEFLRGLCNMQNCRFRHLSQREYEDEVFHALQDEFENLLGPPDRHQNSPQIGNPYGTIPTFHDAPRKYGTAQGDFREDVMPPEDMRGPLMPPSEYESEAKRPRYFSGDGIFPAEPYRDTGDPARKWDERIDYDHVDRAGLNARDEYHLQPDLYALRNENVEIRRNAEREITELKEEVRRVLEENAGLHHEINKVRATATEEAMVQKATIDKLTLTNNTLMEDLRKAEDTARRMEHDSREKLKALDSKQKTNCVELERKIDSLQKETGQLRDALTKANANLKKTDDEKNRLLMELDDLRLKMRSQSGSQSMRKDSQQQHGGNSNYNNKNAFPRDTMKDRSDGNFSDMLRGERRPPAPPDIRDQDMRGLSMRGHERYSPDAWNSDKNGQAQYDSTTSGGYMRGAPEADRSRSWHNAAPQGSWSSHGGAKASSGSLMGEYQGDERMRGTQQNASAMRGPSYTSPAGGGLLNLPIEATDYSKSSRTPQGGPGGQIGMESQYGAQGMMHFDERDYGLSGYDSEVRGSQFGHQQRPAAGWQQGGGDGGRGGGITQAWRREKQF